VREVVLLSRDPRLEEGLRAARFKTIMLPPGDLAKYLRGAPAALIVDVRGQNQLPGNLAAFCKQNPHTGVVLVATTLEPQLMLEAMRAGVNECVSEPITAQAIEEAVRRVMTDGASDKLGRVFAFVGSKGGVGTTTLAVNTAATLARAAGSDVLLMDLHHGYGDAAIFLGVEPRFSVLDALENVHRVDEAFFSGLVEKTKVGIDLLGSSDRLIAGNIDPQRMNALLEFAIHQYRYTVLDVPRSDIAMLDVLESAELIVLVSSQELSALRSAGRLAHTLRARYGASHVKTVLNRFDQRGDIAHRDIERVIGDSVKHLLPSDYQVANEAMARGRPVVLDQGRLSQAFRSLATDLGGIQKKQRAPAQPMGLLGRLSNRR
jgi:pilus assembly protein CpaE